jgi:hypothetical protein
MVLKIKNKRKLKVVNESQTAKNKNIINVKVNIGNTKKRASRKNKPINKQPVPVNQPIPYSLFPNNYTSGGLIPRLPEPNKTATSGLNTVAKTIPKREKNDVIDAKYNKLNAKDIYALRLYEDENPHFAGGDDVYIIKTKVFNTEKEAQSYADRKGINNDIKRVYIPPQRPPSPQYSLSSNASYSAPSLSRNSGFTSPNLTNQPSTYAPSLAGTEREENEPEQEPEQEPAEPEQEPVEPEQEPVEPVEPVEEPADEYDDEAESDTEFLSGIDRVIRKSPLKDMTEDELERDLKELESQNDDRVLQPVETMTSPNLQPVPTMTVPILKPNEDAGPSKPKGMSEKELKEAQKETLPRAGFIGEEKPNYTETVYTLGQGENTEVAKSIVNTEKKNGNKYTYSCPIPECRYGEDGLPFQRSSKTRGTAGKAYKAVLTHTLVHKDEVARQTLKDKRQAEIEREPPKEKGKPGRPRKPT